MNKTVWVIESRAWDEVLVYGTRESAYKGFVENIKEFYSCWCDDFGNGTDPTWIIEEITEQYKKDKRGIFVEDSEYTYNMYEVPFSE